MPFPQTTNAPLRGLGVPGASSPDSRDTKTPPDPLTCKPTDPWKKPLGGILNLDCNGVVHDSRVKVAIEHNIEHGPMVAIHAIVVHQTDSTDADGTLGAYRTSQGAHRVGAHFLIGKNGDVYQTASLAKRCWQIEPIRSRCFEMHTCQPDEMRMLDRMGPREVGRHEHQKSYPARFPTNADAIGIEIVGRGIRIDKQGHRIPEPKVVDYEPLTPAEQRSLNWLIPALLETLHLKRTDIYRHPTVGHKAPGEALSAQF